MHFNEKHSPPLGSHSWVTNPPAAIKTRGRGVERGKSGGLCKCSLLIPAYVKAFPCMRPQYLDPFQKGVRWLVLPHRFQQRLTMGFVSFRCLSITVCAHFGGGAARNGPFFSFLFFNATQSPRKSQESPSSLVRALICFLCWKLPAFTVFAIEVLT